MQTEELIRTLAAEAAPAPAVTPERRAVLLLPVAAAVSVVLFLVALGPRPELLSQLRDPLVAAKSLLPLILAPLALALAFRAARPAAPAGLAARVILAVPLAAAALLVWAFVATPADQRWALFVGHSIPVCLPAITLLSMPMLAGLLAALRRGAPVHLRRAGALAGLAAGGMATVVYSTFCTEDSPLFYSVWYSGGILIVAGLGALAGPRLLRW